jgi:hypothetical protein
LAEMVNPRAGRACMVNSKPWLLASPPLALYLLSTATFLDGDSVSGGQVW